MDKVAFTTPGVDRVFLACDRCQRTVPHYRVYGRRQTTPGMCRCGCSQFRPTILPEWAAAWWVLGVGWLWRKTIRREVDWDPRMPIRQPGAPPTPAFDPDDWAPEDAA